MALTDRTANNLLNAARVASNVDIAAPAALANQLDQRHMILPMYLTVNLATGATYRFAGFVADRAYRVISARLVSPSVITAYSTVASAVAFNVVANADTSGGSADTTLAQLLVTTTTVATYASQALSVQSSTSTIASGQRVDLLVYAGQLLQAQTTANGLQPYVVDVVVQEV